MDVVIQRHSVKIIRDWTGHVARGGRSERNTIKSSVKMI